MRNWRDLGPWLGLAIAWLLFFFAVGSNFASWDNQRLMLQQTAIVGIAAVGATFVIISGGIDLSVGSAIALLTVVVAKLTNSGLPPWLVAVLTLISGALLGAMIGSLVVGGLGRIGRLFGARSAPLPLSPFIVTLALWGALRGFAKGLGDNQPVYLRRPEGVDDWTPPFVDLMQSSSGLPTGVWILFIAAALAAFCLRGTRLGRRVFAIGSNEQTARLCGLRVDATKIAVYAIASGCAALAAILQFADLGGMGDPTTAQGLELQVIAAVVIGGASLAGGEGSITGTLAGAFLMTVVANGCTQLGLENWVQEMVTGGIILAAVVIDRLRSS